MMFSMRRAIPSYQPVKYRVLRKHPKSSLISVFRGNGSQIFFRCGGGIAEAEAEAEKEDNDAKRDSEDDEVPTCVNEGVRHADHKNKAKKLRFPPQALDSQSINNTLVTLALT